MRKRFFTRVLCLVLAVAMLCSLPVFAEAAATSGTSGQARWSYNSSTRTLTFSGTGSTGDYDHFTGSVAEGTIPTYNDYLYSWRSNHATKVVVEAGITRIGDCFVAGASALKEIVLPKTLTTIGPRAFIFCDGLRTINIPVSVKTINVGAFTQCGYSTGKLEDSGKLLTINYEGTRAQWNQINFIGSGYQDSYTMKNATINYLGEVPYPGTPFTDIANHWGKDSIKWVYEQGLFNGVGATTFGPESTMNRGMLVTVLHRLAGEPAAETSGTFGDVADGQFYYAPVNWAYENGIVDGVGGGRFGPKGNVTRQQLAKILYGYAVKFGKDTSIDPAALEAFSDAGKIDSWAVEPMAWAATHGIINGSNGKVNPKGNATRAQVAQIFYNAQELLA